MSAEPPALPRHAAAVVGLAAAAEVGTQLALDQSLVSLAAFGSVLGLGALAWRMRRARRAPTPEASPAAAPEPQPEATLAQEPEPEASLEPTPESPRPEPFAELAALAGEIRGLRDALHAERPDPALPEILALRARLDALTDRPDASTLREPLALLERRLAHLAREVSGHRAPAARIEARLEHVDAALQDALRAATTSLGDELREGERRLAARLDALHEAIADAQRRDASRTGERIDAALNTLDQRLAEATEPLGSLREAARAQGDLLRALSATTEHRADEALRAQRDHASQLHARLDAVEGALLDAQDRDARAATERMAKTRDALARRIDEATAPLAELRDASRRQTELARESRDALEARARELLRAQREETDRLAAQLESMRTSLDEGHREATRDSAARLEKVRDALSRELATTSAPLEALGEEARRHTELLRSSAESSEAQAEAILLAQRAEADRLAAHVDATRAALEQAHREDSRAAVDRLDAVEAALSRRVDEAAAPLAQIRDGVRKAVETQAAHADALQRAIARGEASRSASVERAHAALTRASEERAALARQILDAQGDEATRLRAQLDAATLAHARQLDELRALLLENGVRAEALHAERSNRLAQRLAAVREALDHTARSAAEETRSRLAGEVRLARASLDAALRETTEASASRLAARLDGLETQILRSGAAAAAATSDALHDLQRSLAESRAALLASAGAGSQERERAHRDIASRLDALDARLAAAAAAARAQSAARGEAIGRALAGLARGQLGVRDEVIRARDAHVAASLDATARDHALAETVERHAREAAARLDGSLREANDSLSSVVEMHAAAIRDSIDAHAKGLEASDAQRADELAALVAERADAVRAALDARLREVAATSTSERAADVERIVSEISRRDDLRGEQLDSHRDGLQRSLATLGSELADHVDERADRIDATTQVAVRKASEAAARLPGLEARLAERLDQLDARLAESAERLAAEGATRFASAREETDAIQRALAAEAVAAQRRAADAAASFDGGIAHLDARLSAEADRALDSIGTHLDRASAQSQRELAAHVDLRAGEVLAELDETRRRDAEALARLDAARRALDARFDELPALLAREGERARDDLAAKAHALGRLVASGEARAEARAQDARDDVAVLSARVDEQSALTRRALAAEGAAAQARLRARLDALRENLAEQSAREHVDVTSRIEALGAPASGADLAALRAALDRRAIALDAALAQRDRALAERVELSTEPLARADDLARLIDALRADGARRHSELAARLDSLGPYATPDDLAELERALGTRVDAATSPLARAADVERARAALLGAISSVPASASPEQLDAARQALADQIRAIAGRAATDHAALLDRLAALPTPASPEALLALRAALAERAAQGEARADARAEALADRLRELAAPLAREDEAERRHELLRRESGARHAETLATLRGLPTPASPEDVSRAKDELSESLARGHEAILARVNALPAPATAQDVERARDALARELDRVRAAQDEELRRLDALPRPASPGDLAALRDELARARECAIREDVERHSALLDRLAALPTPASPEDVRAVGATFARESTALRAHVDHALAHLPEPASPESIAALAASVARGFDCVAAAAEDDGARVERGFADAAQRHDELRDRLDSLGARVIEATAPLVRAEEIARPLERIESHARAGFGRVDEIARKVEALREATADVRGALDRPVRDEGVFELRAALDARLDRLGAALARRDAALLARIADIAGREEAPLPPPPPAPRVDLAPLERLLDARLERMAASAARREAALLQRLAALEAKIQAPAPPPAPPPAAPAPVASAEPIAERALRETLASPPAPALDATRAQARRAESDAALEAAEEAVRKSLEAMAAQMRSGPTVSRAAAGFLRSAQADADKLLAEIAALRAALREAGAALERAQ